MQKKFLLFSLIFVLCFGMILTGCSNDNAKDGEGDDAGANGDMIPAIVGYWGGTCEAPIYVAYENGYFEEAGLDVELLLITSDVDLLMANDELDAFELTPDKFKPIEQGSELRIIDSLHIGCIQGAASVESGIETVADLEGKRVAATVGSIAQIQISSEMVKLGLDPKKVEWLSYELPMMEAALDAGEVDAFAAYDPWPEIAVENGKVKFYSNTFDEGLAEYLCCFVGMSKKSLEENPEMAARMSKAFAMACDYISENPEETAKMAIEKGYIAGTPELNSKLIGDYIWVAGDEELLNNSVKEIWMQIYRAGAMEDAPEDIDSYIEDLTNKMVSYHGE